MDTNTVPSEKSCTKTTTKSPWICLYFWSIFKFFHLIIIHLLSLQLLFHFFKIYKHNFQWQKNICYKTRGRCDRIYLSLLFPLLWFVLLCSFSFLSCSKTSRANSKAPHTTPGSERVTITWRSKYWGKVVSAWTNKKLDPLECLTPTFSCLPLPNETRQNMTWLINL